MLGKIFGSKTRDAELLLKNINMTSQTAPGKTSITQLVYLSRQFNPEAPSFQKIFKVVKRQEISAQYLTKLAVLLHFYFGREEVELGRLVDFVNLLKEQWSFLMVLFGEGEVLTARKREKTVVLSTQGQQGMAGQQKYVLMYILDPYLAYLKKKILLQVQQGGSKGSDQVETWRCINNLRLISGITQSFTVICRYYKKEYGNLVILLSEILSLEIRQNVKRISTHLLSRYKTLSLSSLKRQDIVEIDEFKRLAEEMGDLNERFSQLYLGKYFYQEVGHLQRPCWVDSNSEEFKHIFKGRNQMI